MTTITCHNLAPNSCSACGALEPCSCRNLEREEFVHLVETSGCSAQNPGHNTGRVWRLTQKEAVELGIAGELINERRARVTQAVAHQLKLPGSVQ